MDATINAKQLRALLPKVVKRVQKGARFTVLYRSRPAFRIVPLDDVAEAGSSLNGETLFRAKPVGRSRDDLRAADHDRVLYGR